MGQEVFHRYPREPIPYLEAKAIRYPVHERVASGRMGHSTQFWGKWTKQRSRHTVGFVWY